MIYSYKTVKEPGKGLYKEKGSKFLSFVYAVETEEEIKHKLDMLRKEYFDARHHCYAWILGADKSRYRAADDGEPNHSAGDPILGQIRSRTLTNTLIVVVRYFGGTKLGVGGLIVAYKAAAEDALNHAVFEEREVKQRLEIRYPYEATPEVMKLVKEYELEITDQKFNEECSLLAMITLREKERFTERATLLVALGNKINVLWLSIGE